MRTFDVAGVSIPKLGIGTYGLDGEVGIRAVAEGLRAGYRHVDTAEIYGNEAAVGEGLRASGVSRDEVFVTSKVWHEHLADDAMQRAADASLRRLGIDRFDLYLIHWPSRTVSAADAVRSLCRLFHRGIARAVGVSNYPVALIGEAVAAADTRLAVNQVEYHPYIDQSPVLAAVRRHGMGLTAYSPLARGKVASDPVLAEIASRRGVPAATIALAWLIGQPDVIAIPKSASAERLVQNLAAQDVVLDDHERSAIDALHTPDGRLVDPSFAPDWDRPGP